MAVVSRQPEAAANSLKGKQTFLFDQLPTANDQQKKLSTVISLTPSRTANIFP